MASIQSYFLRFLMKRMVNWNKPVIEIRNDLLKQDKKLKLPRNLNFSEEKINGVRGEWFIPAISDDKKLTLYLHGGGYCLGLVNANRKFIAELADKSQMRILAVDYPLAPENPFPAAFDAVFSVYKHLLQQGYSSSNIAFAGDSSGAGLCLSLIAELKKKSLPLPKACVCITPVTDMTGSGKSFQTCRDKDPFNLKDPLAIAKNYFLDHDPKDPRLSPLFAELNNFPPLLIHGAEYDVFLDDAIRFADKAKKSNTDVELKIWDKMWHVFHIVGDTLPEGRQAVFEICKFLKKHSA